MKNKLLTLSFIAILSIVCFPRPASASTYGSNAYGKCAYSTGCAPCPDTTAPSTTSTTPSGSTSGTEQPNAVTPTTPNCDKNKPTTDIAAPIATPKSKSKLLGYSALAASGLGMFAFLIVRRRRVVAILTEASSSRAQILTVKARGNYLKKKQNFTASINGESVEVIHIAGTYPNYKLEVIRGSKYSQPKEHAVGTKVIKSF